MADRPGIFASPKHHIHSLSVQAETYRKPREQGQMEILIRHLLYRFVHHELLTSDGETKRVMQISYAAALPGLMVALFLIPAYHAFPPNPYPRPFWPQVADHYFFVAYSFVLMGAATVYQWDLLFPDLLDVFVLSVLPIASRRLFFARVAAVGIFLALALAGTSGLGILFFPVLADQPNLLRHIVAHTAAVLTSGAFAAAFFLALQGVLLNLAGEKLFRRIAPLLQAFSITLLLAVLLLIPALAKALQPLLRSPGIVVRSFPPFWFLGIYEWLLHGSSAPAVFAGLARTGCLALGVAVAMTILTYPLAYRRRVRQIVEGSSASATSSPAFHGIERLLHRTILPLPPQRAIFHFIRQTILRSQRQRVMLGMYGGLGVAIVLAVMIVFRTTTSGHVQVQLTEYGIRAAAPILCFWTVAGLTAVLGAPVDLRGAWVFRVLLGRARTIHLGAARLWITLAASVIGVGATLVLHFLAPASLRTPASVVAQIVVAVGSAFLLSDAFLYPVRTLPFAHLHRSATSDLPWTVVRYGIFFPFFVVKAVEWEPFLEASIFHLVGVSLLLAGVHLLVLHIHGRALEGTNLELFDDEEDTFPQRLGLLDA
jgi:hypothetical protein